MDASYLITTIIKNKNNEKKYKIYNYDFDIANNKLVFRNLKLEMLYKQLTKLIIGNCLYFIINDDYYNANINKTNYETIKKYNKLTFEVDTNNIVNIIKDNNLYYYFWYNIYLVKKDKELNLFFINNNIAHVYKYINNEFILQKKYIYYSGYLIDENDNLFCFYYYEILPITKNFKYYNYIINLVKYNYNKSAYPLFARDLFYLYKVGYFAYNNNNEINFSLNYIVSETTSIKYENSKIELIGKNIFLSVI